MANFARFKKRMSLNREVSHYQLSNSGKYVEIVLQDSGFGIEADNPNDIFLPFYSTKNPGGKNLGLGLYMSYTLMQKNHGDISVENLERGGCQFTILLPAYMKGCQGVE